MLGLVTGEQFATIVLLEATTNVRFPTFSEAVLKQYFFLLWSTKYFNNGILLATKSVKKTGIDFVLTNIIQTDESGLPYEKIYVYRNEECALFLAPRPILWINTCTCVLSYTIKNLID